MLVHDLLAILLSISQIRDKNLKVLFTNTRCKVVDKEDKCVLEGERSQCVLVKKECTFCARGLLNHCYG